MKRILSLLLIGVFCLSLAGCSMIEEFSQSLADAMADALSQAQPETFETITPLRGERATYTPIECRYSYRALTTEDERTLYERLLSAAGNVSAEINDKGSYDTERVTLDGVVMPESSVCLVMKALYDDNPEIFWLHESYGLLIDKEHDRTIVQLYSRYSPSQIARMNDALSEVLGELFDTIPTGLDEYGVEKYIHDYLIDRCEYDNEVQDDDAYTQAHRTIYMPYGALVEHLAVCEGYARSFQMILNRLGIECVCLMGQGDGELHQWNAVNIDGEWYLVDVTWDDQGDEVLRYNYFNLTDDLFDDDHTASDLADDLSDSEIEEQYAYLNLFIPTCDTDAYNYYVHECAHLTDFDAADVKNALYTAALADEPYLSIYLDVDGVDYDDTVRLLFSDYPQYFFDYAQAVNNQLPDKSIDNSNVSYYENERLSIVTISLSYV